MAKTKHKDVYFYVKGRARPVKSYEEAILDAASRAAMSGKTITIDVYAQSLAGAKWYKSMFGPPNDPVVAYDRSRNDVVKIDTLKLTLK